ncbi:DUF4179 domain-containing protein [Paenibacillaceae sp. P-4]|uniref:DUF4179 domain-containing protein n=1 Tax=Paenibacillaceae bacterium P-4 TaxID=3160969 RepID=UPI0032E81C49
MENKELSQLKQAYDDIEIPEELAVVTLKAIERGKRERQNVKEKRRNRWLKLVGASAAAALVLFVISVNTMPAFAKQIEEIPVLGRLVKILQFNQGSARGGELQGGTDVSLISLRQQGNSDVIMLNFTKTSEQNKAREKATLFNVKFSEYPDTMTFSVFDARAFSALTDLATLKNSRYIDDAYQLITYDDTTIRFNVTFNETVTYEVREYGDPAQVVIIITPVSRGDEGRQPVYSLRTASHPFGSAQATAEEALFDWENVRILKDREGEYFVEVGYYASEDEAHRMLQKLKEQGRTSEEWYVEQREYMQLPKMIPAT